MNTGKNDHYFEVTVRSTLEVPVVRKVRVKASSQKKAVELARVAEEARLYNLYIRSKITAYTIKKECKAKEIEL